MERRDDRAPVESNLIINRSPVVPRRPYSLQGGTSATHTCREACHFFDKCTSDMLRRPNRSSRQQPGAHARLSDHLGSVERRARAPDVGHELPRIHSAGIRMEPTFIMLLRYSVHPHFVAEARNSAVFLLRNSKPQYDDVEPRTRCDPFCSECRAEALESKLGLSYLVWLSLSWGYPYHSMWSRSSRFDFGTMTALKPLSTPSCPHASNAAGVVLTCFPARRGSRSLKF